MILFVNNLQLILDNLWPNEALFKYDFHFLSIFFLLSFSQNDPLFWRQIPDQKTHTFQSLSDHPRHFHNWVPPQAKSFDKHYQFSVCHKQYLYENKLYKLASVINQ